ncbi:MAG: hypothetical protein V4710_08100 [Verrucomicrobiota bacterium]
MKPVSVVILLLGFAGGLSNLRAAEPDERHVVELLARQFAQIKALANDMTSGANSRPQRTAGLQNPVLATGSLQPSSGLASGARGLTPLEEWRRMFPRKEQR